MVKKPKPQFREEFVKKTLRLSDEMKKGKRIHFKSVEEMDAYLTKLG